MFSFEKWTIGKKLYCFSFILLLNLIFVNYISYTNFKKLFSQLENATDVQIPAVRNMTLTDMMHDGLRAVAYHAIISSESKDPKELESVQSEYDEFSKNIKEYIANIEKLPLKPQTKELIAKSLPNIDQYIKDAGLIVSTALTGKQSDALALLPKSQDSFEKLESDLGALGELIEKDSEESKIVGHNLVSDINKYAAIVFVISLIFGTILSIYIVKSLVKQLNGTIKDLRLEADSFKTESTSLNSSSLSLSQSVTEQASAIQETAASIEEISKMVKRSSENANKSKDVASSSFNVATKGKEAVTQMENAISDINDSNTKIVNHIEDSNRQFYEIANLIKEIGKKTNVINDIVFQTKLLSFNASVEAARAGEHGKGFAVVAEEVGNLAQMSGNAAKEITQMLGESIKSVEKIVSETKVKVDILITEGKNKVNTGSVIAKECSSILEEVLQNVSSVSDLVDEISTASNEQSVGIAEITKAMNQMDQVTHSNSLISKTTAESSTKLSLQTDSLLRVVGILENTLYGNAKNSEEKKALIINKNFVDEEEEEFRKSA